MIFIMTFPALIFAAQNAALLLQKSRVFPEGLIAKRKKISMLTISTIKENCFASAYSKGRELFLEKKYKDVEISGGQDEDGEPFQMIQGQVKGHSSHWYTTEVYMDEDDDIKDYYCTCPAYAAYYGMCKHCVALALEYRDMERENKGSVYPVNSWEKDTSAVLNTLMDRFSHQGKGYIFDQYHEQIRFEPEFSWTYSGSLSVEFKIGYKKMYVVKNIASVLYALDTVSNFAYGKNLSFIHDRTVFTQEALEWLDIVRDILRVNHHMDTFENYAQPYYNNTLRSIDLGSYGIQRCMDVFLGKEMEISGKVYRVIDKDPPLELYIRNDQDMGATVSMEPVKGFLGSRWAYVVLGDYIYQCSEGFRENVKPLMEGMMAFQTGRTYQVRPLYLSRKDYRAFAKHMLPALEDYVHVAVENIDFESCLSQIQMRVFLTMADDALWRIELKAQVETQGKIYDFFGDKGMDVRDPGEEFELEQIIRRYFVCGPDKVWHCQDETSVLGLIQVGISRMQQLAQVYVDDKIRGITLRSSPKITVGVRLKSGLLELDIHSDLMAPDEIAQVLSAYKKKKKYFRLKNGDILQLDEEHFGFLSELSEGLMLDKKALSQEQISVPAFRASFINETIRNNPGDTAVHRDSHFRKMVREMREYSDSDFDVPDSVCANLRKYQEDGFRWLCTLSAYGLGGVLADDMGLGKTLQMLAFIAYKKVKTLIVCPASLVYNWESEAGRFTPDLRVMAVSGTASVREKIFSQARDADLVITSYDLLKREVEEYEKLTFDCIVVDEAQYIKNPGTLAARSVKAIPAPFRFALTGTPIENRLSDLWSIFDFIMPGYLYSYQKFRKEMEHPIVSGGDEKVMGRLKAMVSPFILRRRKQDVLKDLPDKLEKTVYIKMTEAQEQVYRAMASRLAMELSASSDQDFNSDQIRFLAELTRLRQICCAPDLCLDGYTGGSGKMDACLELIDNAIAGGHRLLVFSQFTQMLEKLIDVYKDRGEYLYLSGKSTKEQRRHMVDQFQRGDIPVFFISLKAGGTGLNLTGADVVIHYDPWWNVAAQDQATDRTHRIGQKNVVTVMKLVAKGTIEEKIIRLQEEKAKLAKDIIEGGQVQEHRVSREELLELLKE